MGSSSMLFASPARELFSTRTFTFGTPTWSFSSGHSNAAPRLSDTSTAASTSIAPLDPVPHASPKKGHDANMPHN